MYHIKITGAILLIIATSMYGFDLGRGFIKRIDNLKELKKMLIILDGELKYNSTPIKIAFEKISRRSNSVYCDFFKQISISMCEDASISLRDAWEKAVENTIDDKFCLNKNDIDKLKEFGVNLENLDKESRNSLFEGYLNEIDNDIGEAVEDKDNKVKLYRTMGVVSGLFVAILIV